MSRPAKREVSFYTEGMLVETITDYETAKAIRQYKSVYNQIGSYKIASTFLNSPTDDRFVYEAIQAQSRRLRILCIKKYIPNVPESCDGATYECGIFHLKSKTKELVKKDPVARYYGGVPMLYYKLFREHMK